ncbi:MAG: hypothetical protein R8G66_19670 [Cytophagales bacterium]|nr:hypothetical protein [Cytophagales bacterium]
MQKLAITLIIVSLVLSSCTSFQYLNIDSSIAETDNGFIHENDSIRLAYYFTETGAMEIEVHNLSKQLIYVDWNKSALIKDGQSFSLANDQSVIEARTSSIDLFDTGIEVGDVNGTITSTSSMNFIPEGSFIRYQTRNINFEHYDLKQSQGVEVRTISSYRIKNLKVDPLEVEKFQTLLFVADEANENRSIYKHEFWVSEVNETQYNDQDLNGNQVKLSRTTGAGKVLGVVGGAALLTVLVAAELEEE